MKKITALIVGLTSLVYVFNPGAGILELIPDNIPVAGNIDEVLATAIVIAAFRVFNIDLTKKFSPKTKKEDESDQE